MKLREYKDKRAFSETNEPFGAQPSLEGGRTMQGAFVVHLHDATRKHYDLRFTAAGVLASFAVPRGPSLDPKEKRLAVRTEDHPAEYLDFEAVIPKGNYGAGPMIQWDRGRIQFLETSAEEGLTKGKVDFVLFGTKLRGRFALVRTKSDKDWLLIKKADAYVSERDPVVEQPRSVLSGLLIEELDHAAEVCGRIESQAAQMGALAESLETRSLVPMLCAAEGAPLTDPQWIYELKLDGVRAILTKSTSGVVLRSRNLHDITQNYPEITLAARSLPCPRLVLDGEIVCFDPEGRPSFGRLAKRMHIHHERTIQSRAVEYPVTFMVFDLLSIGERSLIRLPLAQRKELLAALLKGAGVIRALDHLPGDGAPLLQFCREHTLEGVIAKRANSRYLAGPKRTGDWVKMKVERDEELVVVGYTVGEGARKLLGALDLATYSHGKWIYRGKVGSGFDEASLKDMLARLGPLTTNAPVAEGSYVPAPRGRLHVRPELVVSVRFLGWTDDGQLRQPVFRGVREDVAAMDCTAHPAFEDLTQPDADQIDDAAHTREHAPRPKVVPTNPEKILWPKRGFTKSDLVAYYDAVAPALLPFLRDRPVMMVRYPDGVDGKFFYQWKVPPGIPSWISTYKFAPSEKIRST